MRNRPYFFYKDILSSSYSKKVFKEFNYDHFEWIFEQVEDGTLNSEYLDPSCDLECALQYIEETDFKPDWANENLAMAAR